MKKIEEKEIQFFVQKFNELEEVNSSLANVLINMFACQLSCSKDKEVIARVLADEPPAFERTLKTFQDGINQFNSLNLGR